MWPIKRKYSPCFDRLRDFVKDFTPFFTFEDERSIHSVIASGKIAPEVGGPAMWWALNFLSTSAYFLHDRLGHLKPSYHLLKDGVEEFEHLMGGAIFLLGFFTKDVVKSKETKEKLEAFIRDFSGFIERYNTFAREANAELGAKVFKEDLALKSL